MSFRHAVFPDLCAGRALDLAPRFDTAPDVVCAESTRNQSTRQPPRLTDDQQVFVEGLFREFGLRAAAYKPETLCRRLPACLRALKVSSVVAARSLLRRRPALARVAIDAMLIGVTEFFRDPPAFAGLCGDVLLELAARRAPYRIWSAGCSTGAELYSVAMLLAQLGALDLRGTLLGTDCRPEALEHAARGRYTARAVGGVPRALLDRYFKREWDGAWRVCAAVRSAVRWAVADVTATADERVAGTAATTTAGPWDLILCRNLAIYLQPDAASRLWARLASALAPGGVLMLGRAERPLGSPLHEPVGPCLYRRRRAERCPRGGAGRAA